MQSWHWFAAIYAAIVLYSIFSWLRVKFVLGRTVMNVWLPLKKLVVSFSLPVLLLSAVYFTWLFRGAGDTAQWYTDERIMMSVLTAAATFSGAYSAILDEQIREEGIYVRQRIYRWNELLNYCVEDCVLKISTTKTKRNGQPREIEWNLHKGKLTAEVAGILDGCGVKECLPPDMGEKH